MKLLAPSLVAPLGLALAAAAACSGTQGSQTVEGAEGAALNVGLGVAAAPIHRAVTGCFTPCAYGTVCDEKSGVCVQAETGTSPASSSSAPPAGAASPAPSASAAPAAGPAVSSGPAAAPSAVAPLCAPACPEGWTCEVDGGRSVCKRR